MSNNVDNRIVEMQFNNRDFESRIKTSTKSLDNLKESLKLDESARSLSNLDRAGKSFSLAGISAGIDALNNKFSTLGIIGITALQNITNAAFTAGKNFVSALTIDPVKTGLEEYETKVNAITTILTNTKSKGTTIDDVNAALNELNTYADKTIYNFSEMTRNIGTFTAAGVGLETSVTSIKGIANLAAGSGSSAQQASTAMYQLSQAIAAGSVKLMDWNSVVNAGMGGEMFQKALEKTAVELGHGRDMSVSFRDSLEKGWITTEVLTKTLAKLAADESLLKAATQVKTLTQLLDTMRESVQSGWAQSWENIIGNRDQAAAFFTAISDGFNAATGASANARNAMLAFWNANGGRTAMIQALSNVLLGLAAILEPIEQAFRDIFPPMTGEKLVAISKAFRDLTAGFKMGAETVGSIGSSFKGLFAVIDIMGQALIFVAKTAGLLVQALFPVSDTILSATGSFGDLLVSLDETIKKGNAFGKALEYVKIGADFVRDALSGGLSYIKQWAVESTVFSDALTIMKTTLTSAGNKITSVVDKIKSITGATTAITTFSDAATSTVNLTSSFEALHSALSKIGGAISKVASTVKSILTPVFNFFKRILDSLTLQDVGAVLTGGGFFMLAKTLATTLSSVDSVLKNFSKVLGEVGDTLKAFQLKIKADALLKIAIAMGILAAAIIALSFIKVEDLGKSLGILSVAFIELAATLTIMNKIIKDVKPMSAQLIALGVSMLLLANAVKVVASIETGKLVQGTVAIGSLMGMLAVFIQATNGGDLATSASGLIGFSIGITILAGALTILGSLNQNKLIQGSSAIAALMATIAAFINFTNGGDLATSAGGLVGFATGLMIITGALAILGSLNFGKLLQGSISIGALMTAIAIFIKTTNGGDLALSAGGLIGFATGITILVGALAILGSLDFGRLLQGGIALAALMNTIAIFIRVTNGGDLATSAGGIIGFAIGITILTKAVSTLASLDTGKVVQGVAAISSIITMIGMFTMVTNGGDLAKTSAGIIGFSAGIIILAGAVALIAAIDTGKAIQGVSVIAALITTIGLFVNLTKGGDLAKSAAGLTGFAIGIAIFAGVIAILSALNTNKLLAASAALSSLIVVIGLFINLTNGSDLAISAVGMIAFAAAIGIMSAALIPLSQLNVANLLAAGGVISLLVLSIGAFVKLTNGGDLLVSAAGLVLFSGAITILGIALATIGAIDIVTLLTGIGTIAATFTVLGIASALLAPLVPVILALSAAIAILSIGALSAGVGFKAFAEGMAIISQEGQPFITSFSAIVTNAANLIPMIATKLGEGIVAFAQAVQNGTPEIIKAITVLADGLIKAFNDTIPSVIEAALKFLEGLLDKLNEYIPPMVDAGLKLVIGILTGISNNIQQIVEVGSDIVIGIMEGLTNKLPDIIKSGVDLISAFLDGIGQEAPVLIDAGFQMVIDFINGLADSIRKNVPLIMDASANLGDAIIDGLIGGLQNNANRALDNIFSIGKSIITTAKDVLGIHSPSKIFKEIGNNLASGLAIGIDNNSQKAVSASENMSTNVAQASNKAIEKSNESAKSAFDKAVEWIDERKYYNELSLDQELEAWQNLQNQYIEGTEERKKADKEVYRVKQEMIKAAEDAEKKSYQNSLDWIDERKYYNQLSLQEELAAWERVQARYVEGTEERKKVDREIYRVKSEMGKASFQESLDWIDQEKYYNRLSLSEELAAWERVQKRYLEGTDERIKADKEVYRVSQEINKANEDYAKDKEQIEYDADQKRKQMVEDYYNKTKEINDKLKQDIQSVNKEYEDAVKSRSDTLYNSYGLFDKVSDPEKVSGEDLINNLDGQVKAFESWQKNINDLTAKGIDEGLVKELQDMGPKSAAQIEALNSLSSDKLDSYVTLWKTKHNEAKTQAIGELESMRIETLQKISDLNTQASVALTEYTQTWAKQMQDLNTDTNNKLTDLQNTWITKVGVLSSVTTGQFDALSINIKTSVKDTRTQTETEFTTLAQNIQDIMNQPDWVSVGANIVMGMVQGVQQKAVYLAVAAANAAFMAYQAAKQALGIHSPSKKFEELGAYSVQGFINGLDNFSNGVIASAQNVGTMAMDALRDTVSNISDILNGDIDTAPVIRPVIDLSDVESGSQRISDILTNRQGINVSSITGKIPNIGNQEVTDDINSSVNSRSTSGNVSFVQNNYSPKSLSRLDIYRQTKNQISAMKGWVSV